MSSDVNVSNVIDEATQLMGMLEALRSDVERMSPRSQLEKLKKNRIVENIKRLEQYASYIRDDLHELCDEVTEVINGD